MILNDTRLRSRTRTLDFPGFTILRKDKQLIGTTATAGGVAIIFPTNWSCVEHVFKSQGDHFEALALVIVPPSSKPIKIATCYNRPGNKFPIELLQEFNDIRLNGNDLPGIFAGDFNCSHISFGSRHTNTYGTHLLQAINHNNLIHFNSQNPTYMCSSSGESNLLDLVLGNSLICPYIISSDTEGDVGSDHYPVKTVIDINIKRSDARTKINFADWVRKLDENLPKIKLDSLSINDQIDSIENIFKSTKKVCTFKATRPKRKLPQEIMQIIQQRKSLLKIRKQTTTQQERTLVTKEYNKVNNLVKKKIKEFEDMQQENLATDISNARDTAKMWTLFNQFKTRNKDIEKPSSPLQLVNGDMAISNEEKSQEFAKHLEAVHQTPNDNNFDMDFKNEVDTFFENYMPPVPCENAMKRVDVRSFREFLMMTKNKSSPGNDQISYEVMKKCNDVSIGVLCKVINNCLAKNIFPAKWKCARVIMVPKPGKDLKFATSYRPISLLSCLGKVYERIICENLVNTLGEMKYLSNIQAGYQKGKSSQEHLFRLSQDVFNGFKERKCTVATFLDVQKAFDAVWHNGLKKKIMNIGLPSQMQNILFSFLEERHLEVNVNGVISSKVLLKAGTPQGSCLSPILYLIFVNDLALGINQEEISVGQYADDVGLYSTNRSLRLAKNQVQKALDSIEKWCQKWQVKINAKKSQAICFSKCPSHKSCTINLKICQQAIPKGNEATYLGVVFDSRLSWERQITKMCERANTRLNLLRAMASMSNKHNPNVLSHLFNSTIKSIFEYPSVCIISAADTHLKKLQIIQNEALRIILKVPSYIPIETMNDAADQVNVKTHLCDIAKQRIQNLIRQSTLVQKTIATFRNIPHTNFNKSPLDIISL